MRMILKIKLEWTKKNAKYEDTTLEWLSGKHRAPVHDKIWARPFLMKGPLIMG